MSVSIIACLAYVKNWGGENTTRNLSSWQKVIPRRNIIIQTANKILNKQGKSEMIFLQIVVIYVSKRWRQVSRPCIFHSR